MMKTKSATLFLDLHSKNIRCDQFASAFGHPPAQGSFDKGDLIGLLKKKKANYSRYRLDFRSSLRGSLLTLSATEIKRLESTLRKVNDLYGQRAKALICIGVFYHSAFGTIVFDQKLVETFGKAAEIYISMYPCFEDEDKSARSAKKGNG